MLLDADRLDGTPAVGGVARTRGGFEAAGEPRVARQHAAHQQLLQLQRRQSSIEDEHSVADAGVFRAQPPLVVAPQRLPQAKICRVVFY